MITCKYVSDVWECYYPTQEARRLLGVEEPNRRSMIDVERIRSKFPDGGYTLPNLLECLNGPIDDGYIDDLMSVDAVAAFISISMKIEWAGVSIGSPRQYLLDMIEAKEPIVVFTVDGVDMLRKHEVSRFYENYVDYAKELDYKIAQERFYPMQKSPGLTVETLLKYERIFEAQYKRFIEWGVLPMKDREYFNLSVHIEHAFIFKYRNDGKENRRNRLHQLWLMYDSVFARVYGKHIYRPTESSWTKHMVDDWKNY